jgi:hypothetical protein
MEYVPEHVPWRLPRAGIHPICKASYHLGPFQVIEGWMGKIAAISSILAHEVTVAISWVLILAEVRPFHLGDHILAVPPLPVVEQHLYFQTDHRRHRHNSTM